MFEAQVYRRTSLGCKCSANNDLIIYKEDQLKLKRGISEIRAEIKKAPFPPFELDTAVHLPSCKVVTIFIFNVINGWKRL